MTLNPRWPGIASPSSVSQRRSVTTGETRKITSSFSRRRLRSGSVPPLVGPGGVIADRATGRHPRRSDRRRRKRDPRPTPGRPRALELPRRSGTRAFGFSRRRFTKGEKRASGGRRDITFAFGPSIVSSITNTRARHGPPRRCAFPARPHSLARRAVPPLPSRHLTYILAKSATAWSSASAPATSTVCFAFIAACITAWCALSAST